ncbi:Antibiotic resistance protein MarC [Candidatus Filomicrobium marinum]|uniref:UPF0056 membrane protein n=2 Tax=Filomicrobium TaxID=119044 RepID=A0A0D6JA26_9HYPH|nr:MULTISPECIES: MarC family protein [Filomicrobium]CFX00627.1 Antibiotic resistance protein MarC [Candidatus Filomicrobium marinum]CPR15278.1 Antibiotic resistance protein MarC [Candidatus Filomicrobium marinum]SDO67839.1 multiple antibiotic resistance protein [Filomicrobium insigne]
MFEIMLASFATFFATVGPVEAAVLFATFTANLPRSQRNIMALRAAFLATLILFVFTLLGQPLLARLGVSIAALQTAGGAVLALIALDMIFSPLGTGFKLTVPEGEEALEKHDLAVFPMATPLLAGPGAMSGGILLAANAGGNTLLIIGVLLGLLAVMAITLVLLLLAPEVSAALGVTAQRVLMRVVGLLLSGIAVQAMFDGIRASGLLGGAG